MSNNKQNDQKEAQKKSWVSNYVIIPLALAATLCAWINNVPNSEPLINVVKTHWKFVIYLVFAAFIVFGDGNMLKDQQEQERQRLGHLHLLQLCSV